MSRGQKIELQAVQGRVCFASHITSLFFLAFQQRNIFVHACVLPAFKSLKALHSSHLTLANPLKADHRDWPHQENITVSPWLVWVPDLLFLLTLTTASCHLWFHLSLFCFPILSLYCLWRFALPDSITSPHCLNLNAGALGQDYSHPSNWYVSFNVWCPKRRLFLGPGN